MGGIKYGMQLGKRRKRKGREGKRTSKTIIPNPAEQKVIRLVIALWEQEAFGLRKIARILNELGVKARSGHWCHGRIYRILKNAGVK